VERSEILLTADSAAMSHYQRNVYLGFVSCIPDKIMPTSLYRRYFIPPVPADERGNALQATLSLRAVESILLNGDFSRKDVSVIRPDFLEQRVNERTGIIGLSSHDPLGLGPATSTWATIFGGTPHNRIEFLLFMKRIRRLKEDFGFKVVLGGSGAWQLVENNFYSKLGIDYLFLGEAEYSASNLFHSILNDAFESDPIIKGRPTRLEDIPPIRWPTNWGLVETSRGCGRGCMYCAPTTSGKLRSIPIDTIAESVRVNLNDPLNIQKVIVLHSDDFLRYGAHSNDYRINPCAIFELFDRIFELGAKNVSFTHASFANIAADESFIQEFTRYLRSHGASMLGCQPGLETGSTRLMSSMMAGKTKPFSTSKWPWIVKEAMRILHENDWHVVSTLIMGLPGESREDIMDTYRLIMSLDKYASLYIPLFFVPMRMTRLSDRKRFISDQMTKEHWLLLERCWRHNLANIYGLYRGYDKYSPPFLKVLLRFSTESLRLLIQWKRARVVEKSEHAQLFNESMASAEKCDEPVPDMTS
jgi:radical SAM superfamily enzyme YgiQ (UPF0313 family)